MILVVDDHPDTVTVLCRFLLRNGFKTACAKNGEEALDLLRTISPRLIILDLQMPVMNGLEMLQELAQDEHLGEIPVLMYSAGHNKAQIETAMHLGAKGFLVKGAVDISELMEAVSKYAKPSAN